MDSMLCGVGRVSLINLIAGISNLLHIIIVFYVYFIKHSFLLKEYFLQSSSWQNKIFITIN